MKAGNRYDRRILLGGIALLCFVLLFIGGPGPDSVRFFRYGWGLGHLICFALWAYLYLQWRARRPAWQLLGEVLVLALVLGAGTELLQAAIGREASWQDLANDLLGSLLGFAFSPAASVGFSRSVWLLRIPLLAIVCWVVIPFVKVSLDDLIAWQQFPLLAGFETPLEASRWGGNSRQYLDSQHAYRGESALRVELNARRYPGVALNDFPQDWSSYRLLRFHIFNPEESQFQFHFRIHDQLHRKNGNRYSDRYNTSLVALPGWTELEIPLAQVAESPKGRNMDLSRIAGMILFVGKLERPRTIYIDEVELVR